MHQERRQAAQMRINKQRDAPFRQANQSPQWRAPGSRPPAQPARRGNCRRTTPPWNPQTPADYPLPHWPRFAAPCRRAEHIQTGTDNLWLATNRIRILHSLACRGAMPESHCPAISSRNTAATAIWPPCPRTLWMRLSNGVSLPLMASEAIAPAANAAARYILGAKYSRQRQRGRHLRAVKQCQAFLRRQHDGLEPGISQRNLRRHHRAIHARLANANQNARPCAPAAQDHPRLPRNLAPECGVYVVIYQRAQCVDQVPVARPRTPPPAR